MAIDIQKGLAELRAKQASEKATTIDIAAGLKRLQQSTNMTGDQSNVPTRDLKEELNPIKPEYRSAFKPFTGADNPIGNAAKVLPTSQMRTPVVNRNDPNAKLTVYGTTDGKIENASDYLRFGKNNELPDRSAKSATPESIAKDNTTKSPKAELLYDSEPLNPNIDKKMAEALKAKGFRNQTINANYGTPEFLKMWSSDVGKSIGDTILGGYNPEGEQTKGQVAMGAVKEAVKETASFGTGIGEGFLSAGVGVGGMAQSAGIGGDGLKQILDQADKIVAQSDSAFEDRNQLVKTLGNVLGSQSFYTIPGVGISGAVGRVTGAASVLKNANTMKKIVNLANAAGATTSGLIEAAGEGGSVYRDELDRWTQITGDEEQAHEIAKGKADFTFLANAIYNIGTNYLGGMFKLNKALDTPFDDIGKSQLMKLVKSSGFEGFQEFSQQITSNIATDKQIMEGATESALYGALFGMLGGGGQITKGSTFKDLLGEKGNAIIKKMIKDQQGFAKVPWAGQIEKLLTPTEKKLVNNISSNEIIENDDTRDAKESVKAGNESMTALPLLVGTNPNGTYYIKDGNHRYVQAINEGVTEFPVMTDEKAYREIENRIKEKKIPTVASKIKDTITDDFTSVEANVADREGQLITQLEESVAKKRVPKTDDSKSWGVIKSTFPDWLEAGNNNEYRKNAQIKPFLKHYYEGTLPTEPKDVRFYNMMKDKFKEEGQKIRNIERVKSASEKEIDVNKIQFSPEEKKTSLSPEQDWEDNYSEKAEKLFSESTKLGKLIKDAKKADKILLEKRKAKVDKEAADLEQGFLDKYSKEPKTEKKGISEKPKKAPVKKEIKKKTVKKETAIQKRDRISKTPEKKLQQAEKDIAKKISDKTEKARKEARDKNVQKNKIEDAKDKARRQVTKQAMKKVFKMSYKIAELKSKLDEGTATRKELLDFANFYLKSYPEVKGTVLNKIVKAKKIDDVAKVEEYIYALAEKQEQKKAVARVKKTIEKVKKRLRSKQRGKGVRGEYKTKILEILDGITTNGEFSDKKKNRLSEIRNLLVDNNEMQLPSSLMNDLSRMDDKSINTLSTVELAKLEIAIKHLVALSDLKNTMIIGKQERDAEKTVEKAIENVKGIAREKLTDERDQHIKGFFEGSVTSNKLYVNSMNAVTLSEILDGGSADAISSVFVKGFDQAETEMRRNQQAAEDFFIEKLVRDGKKLDISGMSESIELRKRNVSYKSFVINTKNGTKKIEFTPAQTISFYLTMQRDLGSKKILRNGFYYGKRNTLLKPTKEQADMIIATMSRRDKIVANAMHEYFNDFQKNWLNRVSNRILGFDIAPETNYFPIQAADFDGNIDMKKSNMFKQALDKQGIFKDAKDTTTPLVINDAFNTVYAHLTKTSAFIGYSSAIRNAKMLINNDEFKRTITNRVGINYVKYLDQLVKDVENSLITAPINSADRNILGLQNRLTITILGYNPWVALKQPVSLVSASTEIDGKYIRKGMLSGFGNRKLNDLMAKYSPQLRDRQGGNLSRETGELGKVGATRSFFARESKPFGTKAMVLIKELDGAAIRSIWKSVEEETKKLKPELKVGSDEYYKHVAQRTEDITRKTQPTFAVKDRSAIARTESTTLKMFTMFTSQVNKNFNILVRAKVKFNNSNKTLKDRAKYTYTLFNVVLLNALLVAGIDELRDWIYGYKRKEKDVNTRVKSLMIRTAENTIAPIYGASAIEKAYMKKVKGEWNSDVQAPVLDYVDSVIGLAADSTNLVMEVYNQDVYKTGTKAGEAKWKYTALNVFKGSLKVSAPLYKMAQTPVTMADSAYKQITQDPDYIGNEEYIGSGSNKLKINTKLKLDLKLDL